MSENKKYYFLKLKEDFFECEDMKILESMENGYLYSNILLKLYLKSLKYGGRLVYKDYIPYDIKMLSVITGHNKDIVEKAIQIFKNMQIIDILDNGTIYMLDVQTLIGSITDEGLRKAQYREKIQAEKELGTKMGHCPDIKYIYSNILSNNNINRGIIKGEEEKEEKEESKEKKIKFGEYKRITLTKNQYENLCKEFGTEFINEQIKQLDEYVESNNNKNKYKNFNLVLRKSIRENWFSTNRNNLFSENIPQKRYDKEFLHKMNGDDEII